MGSYFSVITKYLLNNYKIMRSILKSYYILWNTPARFACQLCFGLQPRSPLTVYGTYLLCKSAIFGLWPEMDAHLFTLPSHIHTIHK